MFEPKIVILVALVVLASAFFVWVAGNVAERLNRDKFKCAHCRRRCENRDKDAWFQDGICKTCGEYLIPYAARNKSNDGGMV